MPQATVEIPNLVVRVHDPMHIGSGFARGLINRTVLRGRDGLVYIPGSTIKGKVRDACASLAYMNGLCDCQAPQPALMAAAGHRATCIVCRLFGAPAQPATLIWHQANLTPDWVKALGADTQGTIGPFSQTATRTQVQISRKLGTAAEARLFSSEFALAELTFIAKPAVTGRLNLTPSTFSGAQGIYHELVLLLAGLRLIDAIGGARSRGAGQCEIILPQTISVDGQPIAVDTQLAHIEELLMYSDDIEALK